MRLESVQLDDLVIDDERAFRHVGLYDRLKQALRNDGYRFRAPQSPLPWDRALFLNLTFWSAREPSDVLTSRSIPADVVMHAAWHHLARKNVASPASADALFFGEAIASAFDVYLVGRLLGHAPDAQFLESQVPAMAEAAEAAGVDEAGFEAMLDSIAKDPERAFEDLRQLLFDAGTALVGAGSVDEALETLGAFAGHRFASLLHHYELSNWVLYARAYAPNALTPDAGVRALDAELRGAKVALDWLDTHWLDDK